MRGSPKGRLRLKKPHLKEARLTPPAKGLQADGNSEEKAEKPKAANTLDIIAEGAHTPHVYLWFDGCVGVFVMSKRVCSARR
jgi:hypothetical protein